MQPGNASSLRTCCAVAALFANFLLVPLSAQTRWEQKFPFTNPPGRYAHGLTFDEHRGRIVMFGGFGLPTYLGDTWEYDGNNWLQMTPPSSPAPRFGKVLVYDAARRKTLLFGGGNSFGFLADTWEWNGTFWVQRNPVTSPPQRGDAGIAYDAARERVVIFGGWDGTRRSDTWEWDGTNWTQMNPAASPPGRSDQNMAYDAARKRVVLFGGYSSGSFGDTWEWDGTNWTPRAPLTSPPARSDQAMTFDAGRGTVLIYGGAAFQTSQRMDDTWEWDGTNWSKLTLSPFPPGRWVNQMAYDSWRGRCVHFGGLDNFNLFPQDTWEFITPDVPTYRPFGQACASSAGLPSLALNGNALARLGGTHSVELRGLPLAPANVPLHVLGFSSTSWVGGALPYDLAPLNMPGCRLYVSFDILTVLSNLGGRATFAIGIPNDLSLLGVRIFDQGAVVDPLANLGALAWTDAGEAKLGK